MKIAAAFISLIVATSPAFAGSPASPEPAAQPKTDDARVLFNAGRDFMDDGRYNDAEKKFREVLSKYPKSDQADKSAYYLITTLAKLGRGQDALAEIEKFQKNYPQSKWMSDVQEKRISLTNQVPDYLTYALPAPAARPAAAARPAPAARATLPSPPAPPSPPAIATPFGTGAGAGSGGYFYVVPGTSSDPETSLQQEVLRVLLQNDADHGIDLAIERLKSDPGDPVVISNLSSIANSNSSKALPMLINIAKTSSIPRARRDATFFIGRSRGDKDARIGMLQDILATAKDTDTEGAVVSALAEINTPRSSAILQEIATDKNRSLTTRRNAINAVGQSMNLLNSTGQVGFNTLAALEDLYKATADNTDLRRSIVTSIGRSKDARAISVLAGIAKNDSDRTIRSSAIQAIGSRKDPEAIKALEDLLKDSPAKPRADREDSSDDEFAFNFNFDLSNVNQAIAEANFNLENSQIPSFDFDEVAIREAEAAVREAEAELHEKFDDSNFQQELLDLHNQLQDLQIGK